MLHVYVCVNNHHCFIKEEKWAAAHTQCPICKDKLEHHESCQRTSSHAPQVIREVKLPEPVKEIKVYDNHRFAVAEKMDGDSRFNKPRIPVHVPQKPVKVVLSPQRLQAKGYKLQQPQPKHGYGVWTRKDTRGRTWYKVHKV